MTTITATAAKQAFGNCLMNVSGGPIIIEKSGSPAAVMISYEEFMRLTEFENIVLLNRAIEAAREGFLTEEESSSWVAAMNEKLLKR
jgi:prevent-host-death family protein